MTLAEITATLSEVPVLLKLGLALRARPESYTDCIAARLERTAAKFPDRSAIVFEGREVNWGELNALSNRFVQAFKSSGLSRGDSVSLMMENRIEFVAVIFALNKMGITAGLMNTNLSGQPLAHCMAITQAKYCVFGEECKQAIEQVRLTGSPPEIAQYLFVPDSKDDECPDWASDMSPILVGDDVGNPPDTARNTHGDIALYVFTSGTTGLPKAALVSNGKVLKGATVSAIAGLRCTPQDRIYICLPLYHATALYSGLGGSVLTGASVFLRRRFSSSHFLAETREYNTTHFVYVGELCRYLLNTEQASDDGQNPLKTVLGNGLRPDVWQEFKARFGIDRVSEFYGASEGNIAFMNFLNKERTVGMSPVTVALITYDVANDEIVRDSKGLCSRVNKGDAGLLIGKISDRTPFEGYTSKEDSEKKILRDVFEDGDAWFNTGDLMKTVPVGFSLGIPHYQFVDRVGDTFRWKAENVSTNQVGDIINHHPQIEMCNVYGVEVPGTDGRAGMAALLLSPEGGQLDIESLSQHIVSSLPSYARPVFLRILPAMDMTGTFKLVKGKLRDESYDPEKVTDSLYVMKPGSRSYEVLSLEFARQIFAGNGGF